MCSPFDAEQSIASLQRYQSADAFLAEVEKFRTVTDERFFNDNRYKKVQEAWIAGHCARALETLERPVQVRLVADRERFPDFQMQIDGREHEFEVVTVMKPNRKLGQEYKRRAHEKLLLTPYRPALGERRGPCWVAVAIHRKARKHYGTRPHLLIYANFEANELDLKHVAAAAGAAMEQFLSVWVLWRTQLGKVHDASGTFPDRNLHWLHKD